MSHSLTRYPKDIDRNRRGAANAAKTQRDKRKPSALKTIGVKVGTQGVRERFAGATIALDDLDKAWRG